MFSDLLQQLLLALLPNEPVYYIGGSEVLPPPLSREAEDLPRSAPGIKAPSARSSSTISGSSSISRGGLKTPAWDSRI